MRVGYAWACSEGHRPSSLTQAVGVLGYDMSVALLMPNP
jgi:hypothetical protein